MSDYFTDGYALLREVLEKPLLKAVQTELLQVSNLLASREDSDSPFNDLDEAWNYHKSVDRSKASLLYNGFKYLPTVKKVAIADSLLSILKKICGVNLPALTDINCRIDSHGEEKFLFDWHQDYWFSCCSTKAVVVWIPVASIDLSIGGLELISNKHTNGRVLNVRAGSTYNTYADAILLDEPLPTDQTTKITDMCIGDILVFSFNTLHKSLPVDSLTRSRFTIQLRFADYADPQFIEEEYRTGTVTAQNVDYLKRGKL